MRNKREFNTGVISRISICRQIPKRHQPLYYQILSDFNYTNAEPEDQILVDQIGWTFCKLKDVQDFRYLYGVQLDLPDKGQQIHTMNERIEKQKELELIPMLQKSLMGWIQCLRDGCRKNPTPETNELGKVLSTLANSTTD